MVSSELNTISRDSAAIEPVAVAAPAPLPAAWLIVFAVLLLAQLPPVAQNWWTYIRRGDQAVPVAAALFIVLGFFHLKQKSEPFLFRPSRIGLALLVVAGLLEAACGLLCLTQMQIAFFLAVVASLVWSLGGAKCFRQWMPLFVLSIFLLPTLVEATKAQVSLPLQMVSTRLAVALAHLVIPITSSGHYYTVSGHTYDVAPGCSGLGMWVSLALCFALWQVFDKFSLRGYAVALVSIPVLTVVLNSVRLAITALLGYYFSMKTALDWHANLEYALLPLGCVVVWFSLRNLRVKD